MEVTIADMTMAVGQDKLFLSGAELWRLAYKLPDLLDDLVVVTSRQADVIFERLIIEQVANVR